MEYLKWWEITSFLTGPDPTDSQAAKTFERELDQLQRNLQNQSPIAQFLPWLRAKTRALTLRTLQASKRQEARWWFAYGEILRGSQDWTGAYSAFGHCLRLIPPAEWQALMLIHDRYGQIANILQHSLQAMHSYRFLLRSLHSLPDMQPLAFQQGDLPSFRAHCQLELARAEGALAAFAGAQASLQDALESVDQWVRQLENRPQECGDTTNLHAHVAHLRSADPVAPYWLYLSLALRKEFAYVMLRKIQANPDAPPDMPKLADAYTLAASAAADSAELAVSSSQRPANTETATGSLVRFHLAKDTTINHHLSVHPTDLYSFAAEIALAAGINSRIPTERSVWFEKTKATLDAAWKYTPASHELTAIASNHFSSLSLHLLEYALLYRKAQTADDTIHPQVGQEVAHKVQQLGEQSLAAGVHDVAGASYLLLGHIVKSFDPQQARGHFVTALEIFADEHIPYVQMSRSQEAQAAINAIDHATLTR